MDGKVVIGTELDTKGFDAQIELLERKLNDMVADYQTMSEEEGFRENSYDAMQLRAEIEKTTRQLDKLYETEETGSAKMGSSLGKVIKKVGKWGLALFGVRSAYMFIRQAMSTLSQYNQDMANKIQTIKTALATALEPIITRIVDLVYKLVGYLGYFIKQWTGFDIFKNSAKSMKSGVKTAKQLKKELAGFDEMNILGQNTTVSGGGTSAGLNGYGQLDPEVLEKIKNFAKTLKNLNITIEDIGKTLGIVIGTIATLKVAKWVSSIAKIIGVSGGTAGLLGIVVALGLIDAYLIGWVLPKKIKEASNALKDLNEAEQNNVDININGLKNSLNWLKEHEKQLEKINAKKDSGQKLTSKENQLLQQQKLNQDNVNSTLDKVNGKVKTGYKLTESQRQELDKIKSDYQALDKKTFKNDINTKVTMTLEEDKKNTTFWTKLKNSFKKIISGSLSPVKGISFNAKGAVYYPPRLASGGVINRPGRGIPLGSAIGGERGAEGVIPLTDSQQMALLGEAIGRYITINATIPVYAYNRQVDRQMRRIQAEDNFASNR